MDQLLGSDLFELHREEPKNLIADLDDQGHLDQM